MEHTDTITLSEKRARFAITFVVMSVAVGTALNIFIAIGMQYIQSDLILGYATFAEVFRAIVGLGYGAVVIVFIASAITFIMWFWKAYGNLQKMGSWMLDARGWTIGCWFVPLFNVYLPYMHMRQMFDAVNALLVEKDELSLHRVSTRIVGTWWGILLFVGFLSQFTNKISVFVFAKPVIYGIVILVVSVLNILLAYVTVRLIRSFVVAEKELMAKSDNDDNLNL